MNKVVDSSVKRQEGNISLDPKQISKFDLTEAYYMLLSSSTLLRQAFGIVNMLNSLLDTPFNTDELKAFGKSFDLVHKTHEACAHGLKSYIDKMPND